MYYTPKIKVIITGATGMVGEGVLLECLKNPDVEQILSISRRSCGYTNPKLKEIVLPNLEDLSSLDNQLSGYDACFYCLGVSSVGMKEDDYRKVIYDLTMSVAGTFSKLNPGMTFCYISGQWTDSTEKGKLMWARVKGKTENDLMKLPFKKVFAFRPGYLHPTPGAKNTMKYYSYIAWLYPILRLLFPGNVSKLSELGYAMINSAIKGFDKQILEVNDINLLGKINNF